MLSLGVLISDWFTVKISFASIPVPRSLKRGVVCRYSGATLDLDVTNLVSTRPSS